MTIREQLRLHQEATDCTDSQMLDLVCGFFEQTFGGDYPTETWDGLIDYVQENLERGPGDVLPRLPRYDPRFTDADKQLMWLAALDEAADLKVKEIAELVMDSWDMSSCVAACTVIAGEHSCEPLAEMLQRIDNKGEEEYITGEFLREHDDGDGYPELLDYAKRMGLINVDETELTELGREYMGCFV